MSMELSLNNLKNILSTLVVYKKDIVIIIAIIAIALIIKIAVAILKNRLHLSKAVTKIINSALILLFVEYARVKVSSLWLLKILFILETVLLFLIAKTAIIDIYIKSFLISKRHKKVSHIIVDVIQLLVIAIFAMVFLRNVFNVNLITLLTPSAILTAIIGLSMKDIISNLISGIVIQIEKPFDIGDWININDLIGEVKEINWRYTKIKTLLDMYVIVPNNTISSANIINYSQPLKEVEISIEMGVTYEVPPIKVKRAIYEILEKCKYVLKHRQRRVYLKRYDDFTIVYAIVFGVADYSFRRDAIDEIYSSIWYQFKKYNIEIPFPIRTLVFKKKSQLENRSYVIDSLRKNELFKMGKKETLELIVSYGNILDIDIGERVIKEGDWGNTMYIIIKGEFNVYKEGKQIATLKPGDFFGEVSLLSDIKRNATVVAATRGTLLEIDRMLFQLALEKDEVLRNDVYEKFKQRYQNVLCEKEEVIEEKKSFLENLKRLCGF